MDNKGLSAKLWVLSKQIQEKVKEYKSSKQLTKTKELYLKQEITDFSYKEGNIGYTMSHRTIKKTEWDVKKFFDFTEKVVKQIPDYHHIASEISERYGVNKGQADFWLKQFTQTITRRAFEGLPEETLVDTISTFVNDLEKGPIEWKLKVWIDGVWLEDEEYDIYICIGSSTFSPILKGTVGEVGVIRASNFSKAWSNSLLIRVRTF